MSLGLTPNLPPTSLQGLVAGVARNAVEAAKASGAVPDTHQTASASDAFAGDATGLMGLPEEGLNGVLDAAFATFDEAAAFSGIDPGVPLAQGVEGQEGNVSALQAGLNAMGASPALTVDGQYGPGTAAAVSSFQAAMGLPVTGEAGTETLWAMTVVESLASATLVEGQPEAQAEGLRAARFAMSQMPEGTVSAELEAMVSEFEAYVGAEGPGITEEDLAQDLVMTPEPEAEDPALDMMAVQQAETARAMAKVNELIAPEGGSASTSAIEAYDQKVAAAVAEVEAADASTGGDSDGLMALATPEWIASAPRAAVAKALELMGDDFWTDNEEAGVAGRLTARLASEDPAALPGLWASYQEGAGSNNGRAFADAFLTTCSPRLMERLVREQPAVMRDFAELTDGGLLTTPTLAHYDLAAVLRRAGQIGG